MRDKSRLGSKKSLKIDMDIYLIWWSEDEKKDAADERGIQCNHRTSHITMMDLRVNDGPLCWNNAKASKRNINRP